MLREVLVFGLAYVGLLLVVVALERRFIFPASAIGGWDAPGDLDARDVWLTGSDGTKIHAWWCPVPDARLFVLYSHGNAGNLSHRRGAVQDWQRVARASVLIYDYPGYGKSGGAPSEASCVAAGQAAYDWLRQDARARPEQIILYGKSLGAAVATELAVRNSHRLLVLFCPFTSIPDMAQATFPFLPARYLVQTQFDNRAKLASFTGPVLIGHGRADTIVPCHHSECLVTAGPAGSCKRCVYPGVGHHAPPLEFLREAAAMAAEP